MPTPTLIRERATGDGNVSHMLAFAYSHPTQPNKFQSVKMLRFPLPLSLALTTRHQEPHWTAGTGVVGSPYTGRTPGCRSALIAFAALPFCTVLCARMLRAVAKTLWLRSVSGSTFPYHGTLPGGLFRDRLRTKKTWRNVASRYYSLMIGYSWSHVKLVTFLKEVTFNLVDTF